MACYWTLHSGYAGVTQHYIVVSQLLITQYTFVVYEGVITIFYTETSAIVTGRSTEAN